METVPVGNPGNAPDTRYETPGYGSVGYSYRIGKYEVTNAQYCEFLNAVADADTNNLYNTNMGSGYGGITRSGSSPNYTYNVISGRENKPVNWVSWYDTLRFANWMHNGQSTGAQCSSTTEDGAYDMSLGAGVVRKPEAKVFLTSEDEWYKAAYYKAGGVNAGFWAYPTQSDFMYPSPRAEAPPGTDMIYGSANYHSVVGDLTDVGSYTAKPSDSSYGTFDQAGNVYEWNEADIYGYGSFRGLRGGSFCFGNDESLLASFRNAGYPTSENNDIGFRVAEVPEPCSASLLLMGCLVLTHRRRRMA
jgi:formylglycine-generating enzyme required for sulfatase activity